VPGLGTAIPRRGQPVKSLTHRGPFCFLSLAYEPACQSYARVTIVDSEGAAARGCPPHAVTALNGITRAHVDWPDSKGLNQWERSPLAMTLHRRGTVDVSGPEQQAAWLAPASPRFGFGSLWRS
jgi:hypothetical protein